MISKFNSKSALMSATTLMGVVGSAFVATPALAATGSINGVTYEARPNVCRLTIDHTVTGVTSDGGGADRFRREIESPSFGLENSNTASVPVGTTRNYPGFILDINNGRREQRTVVLNDLGNPGQGSIGTIDTFTIPRADLIAEGGKCAEFAPNNAPVIDAGNDRSFQQNNNQSVTINLVATVSDADGDAVNGQYTQVSGPAVNALLMQNNTQAVVEIPVVSQPTVFTFEYSGTDDALETVKDTVSITVAPQNSPPTVSAGGDQRVDEGDTVQLEASANDQDNDPLTFSWTQTSGTPVTLSDPTIANPTFTAPARRRDDQELVFEVTVSDGTATASDTVEVTVTGNEAPVAVATITPANGLGNSTFTLDGSGTTDPEGDQIFYQWVQTSGPSGTIDDPSAAVTTFTAPPGGTGTNQTITFELRATDNFDETGTDTASATLLANRGPRADAGADQDVQGGVTVTLDGSGSTDPEGDPLTYTWTQVSGPSVTLSDPNAVMPTFTAPGATATDQDLVFQLLVEDRTAVVAARTGGITTQAAPNSPTDTVTITVLANQAPIADAGVDQGPIDAGQTVTLDGTGSSDPDGDTLTYSWVQTGGPSVTLSDPNAAQPTFTAPSQSGTVTFELTVSDGNLSATDSVDVEIRAVGTITIVQRVVGSDTQVTFTSGLSALATTLTTSNGVAQVTANNVPVGTYTVTAADLSTDGLAITDITCSDSDSTGDVANRQAVIDLSAGEDVTCTFTSANSREAAQATIYSYLTGRNTLILASQPDLQRRLDRLSGGPAGSGMVTAYGVPVPGSDKLPVKASISGRETRVSTSLSQAMGLASDVSVDVWAEASYSRANIGTQEADFGIIHIGADAKVTDDVLVGALVQIDDYSDADTLEVGEGEGNGWMAGPYVVARLSPQLYGEVRAAWGASENTIVPLAGQRDSFDTNRSLYSGSLYGEVVIGNGTVLRPALTVRYFSEEQEAYTDQLGIAVPEMTVDQGDVSFRPRISHTVALDSGWRLRPYGEVEAIYTFGTEPDGTLARLLPGFTDTFGDFRGRIEGGVDLFGESGFRASLSGFHDGIGADGFENTGVQVGVSFGF